MSDVPQTQIGFDQVGLGTALKQNQLFVPPNQREYAWTDVEVTQMFQDFSKAISDGTPYFLGTLVTIPRGNDSLEVSDGQQRLATAALLLAAIRDYLIERHEPVLVESINGLLTGIKRKERERAPKLALNIDDNDIFTAIVGSDGPFDPKSVTPTRPSNDLLLDAYKEARQHVKKVVSVVDAKQHGDYLDRWVTFIEFDAQVILLRVPRPADAYKMFETLNDRGLRVGQADLIKNYLFSKSGERFNEVQNRWSYMRGALEALDEEDITINFLRHALVLQRGYLSAKEVYDAVQDSVKGEQGAVSFASHLESMSSLYVATFNPEHEIWNGYPQSVRKSITVLDLLTIRPMRALLLAIAAHLEPKETAEALSYLISVGVRLLIAATVRSGSVESTLSDAARDIHNGSITTAEDLKVRLTQLTPSDSQFKESFERARVTSAKLGRYYLRSLERAAKGEHTPWFLPEDDAAIINLEHVLPQRPEDNWPDVSEDDVTQYAKRLGNLVLMLAKDNADLRSAGFAQKRQVYKQSPYVLTSQVAESVTWTPQEIIERQKILADYAVLAWPAK
jgi:hypothetical protein